MKIRFIICLGLLLGLCCCGDDKKEEKIIEVFSEAKPFTVEIKRERSYFQANKIANRLIRQDIDAYVLSKKEDDGKWYNVVSGAFASKDSADAFIQKLDSLGLADAKIVDYAKLDSTERVRVVDSVVVEKRRIEANEPDVPECVKKVVKVYPENDMFYLQRINIFTFDKNGFELAKNQKLDMPRGVKLSYFKKLKAQSFASVIYKDNLFGDNVTLQVVCLADKKNANDAGFLLNATSAAASVAELEICSELADMILETGTYQNESKDYAEVDAYTKLMGYKVSFIDKGKKRCYYILVDQGGEYIYIAQSEKRKDQEMLSFLAEIGKSDGLVCYDEFYNSFYLVADDLVYDDVFLGYSIDKLTRKYAKEKGNANWARAMVGMWNANVFFYSEKDGMYGIGFFDMVSESQGRRVYDRLYKKNVFEENKRNVYGEDAIAVYHFNWLVGKYLSEINFRRDRYVVAMNVPYGSSERSAVKRLESLQLVKGGYKIDAEPESVESVVVDTVSAEEYSEI